MKERCNLLCDAARGMRADTSLRRVDCSASLRRRRLARALQADLTRAEVSSCFVARIQPRPCV